MGVEWHAAHIEECRGEPIQEGPQPRFCIGCAFERQAETRAFAMFHRLVAQWFCQPSWGRG